jgi:hypothetical protein
MADATIGFIVSTIHCSTSTYSFMNMSGSSHLKNVTLTRLE